MRARRCSSTTSPTLRSPYLRERLSRPDRVQSFIATFYDLAKLFSEWREWRESGAFTKRGEPARRRARARTIKPAAARVEPEHLDPGDDCDDEQTQYKEAS